MTVLNMREFLDIDADRMKMIGQKKSALDSESEYEDGSQTATDMDDNSKEIFFSFSDIKNNKILNMKVQQNENRTYELQYFEVVNQESI